MEMIRQIRSVTWKDLKILFTDTGGVVTLFLMPLMFIIVMSLATQGMYGSDSSDQPRRLPAVNLDNGEIAAEVIAQLNSLDGIVIESAWEDGPLTRDKAESLVSEGQRAAALVFPADFSVQVEARLSDPEAKATIELITDPAASTQFIAPIQAMVYGVAEQVVETRLAPDRIEAALAVVFAGVPGADQLPLGDISFEAEETSVITLSHVAPAGMNIEVFPDTYQQNVPGYTVFGVFFIVSVISSSILQEKHDGTFRRLLAAPLPKPVLLAGKLLPYYLVNLIQVGTMFAVGHFVFGMRLGDPAALAVMSVSLASAATALGVLVATFGKTERQIDGLATLLTLAMSALGGCLIPSFVMPEFMQSMAHFVPHYWAMQGFQDVLVRGAAVASILPEAGALAAFAVVFFLVGVWRFRFE
jgi:ABC-2 type transport system permease protein